MARDDKRLIELFEKLGEGERRTLLDFAEFLALRSAPREIGEPREIPRPERESVIGAVKRLGETYYMVDKSKILHETSGLVTEHLMQGRAAYEVIDELEVVFRRQYERLVEGSSEKQ
jgi:hypothetical protein